MTDESIVIHFGGGASGSSPLSTSRTEAQVDKQLTDLGVKHVVIPRKGKPSQARRANEHRRAFRRKIKWRTGCEDRISNLKRGYGWDRTRIDGNEGARIWTGHGVLSHNLVKISRPRRLIGHQRWPSQSRRVHSHAPNVAATDRHFFRSK